MPELITRIKCLLCSGRETYSQIFLKICKAKRYVNEPLSHCTAEGNKHATVDLEPNMRPVNICFLFVVAYVALGECNSWLDKRDYGFLFWPKNHKNGDGGYSNIEHIQTGTYGAVLDVSTASLVNLGLIQDPLPVEEALVSDNSVITSLPTASVSYSMVLDTDGDGIEAEYPATGFFNTAGTTENPSQMINMGRFMQHVEVPQVTYNGIDALTGNVQVAAMTRHLVLTHRITSSTDVARLAIRIYLSGEALSQYYETVLLEGTRAISIQNDVGEGWSFIIPEQEGVTSTITRDADLGLVVESSSINVLNGQALSLPLIAVPSTSGGQDQLSVWLYPMATVSVEYVQMNRDGSDTSVLTQASFDQERGVYFVPVQDLRNTGFSCDWADPNQHNWFNRHRLVITNNNAEDVSIPIFFYSGDYYQCHIVAGSPLLRDMNGEPIGAPMQISKNWHDSTLGQWYHVYTALTIPPGAQDIEHTFVHSKWGESFAAAHAQLCLIGYNVNQQWDESSLGAFGESITYDPDLTLGRSTVDDVRPFLVNADGEWSWTGNVGGANFFVYASSDGYELSPSNQFSGIRTHYEYTGPNLAQVIYAGKSRDGKIDVKIKTQLGRTDDLVRVYYQLEYNFIQDVTYDRLAFFQMPADGYADNGYTRFAYGNETGVTLDQEITDHGTTGYPSDEARGIQLPGDSPWVMLYAYDPPSDNLAEHLANTGFVVRGFQAKLGDATISTPHINLQRTYNGGKSQIAF